MLLFFCTSTSEFYYQIYCDNHHKERLTHGYEHVQNHESHNFYDEWLNYKRCCIPETYT